MSLSFSALLHAGRDVDALTWANDAHFGQQRIMWAMGPVNQTAGGGCMAELGYHAGARALASLDFPGFAQPCSA
jgi:hypothetical protein